jgi:hypothetical protein
MNCPPLIGGASRIKAFDRGMVWAYAFNTKSRCGASRRRLAWIQTWPSRWGIAYFVGPKYNEAWDAFDPVELGSVPGPGSHGAAVGRRWPRDGPTPRLPSAMIRGSPIVASKRFHRHAGPLARPQNRDQKRSTSDRIRGLRRLELILLYRKARRPHSSRPRSHQRGVTEDA